MFLLISSIVMGCIALYVITRAVCPLACPPWLRWALALAIFIAAEKILILRYIVGRTTAQLDLPPFVIFGTGFAQGFVVLAAVLFFARDIVLLARWLWFKSRTHAQSPRTERTPLPLWLRPAPLLLVTLLCTGWSVWQAAKVPEVRAITLNVPALPTALKDMRIVQLADLHIGAGFDRAWLAQVVERTNALKPAMVVITGDIVDGPVNQLRERIAPLLDLQSRYGTFLVAGNHEYIADFAGWVQEFRAMGITVLTNEHRVIDVDGTPLVVAGVTDPIAPVTNNAPPDPELALQGTPDAVTLMLSHQPRTAHASAAAGAHIQLSGHTHGGLIWPLQPLVSLFNEGFVAGLYTVDTMLLYVHRGSGLWAGFPVRLGVPSEIADITLQ